MKKLLILLACGITLMANELIVKTSECSFDATLDNLKTFIKEKGLTVFGVIEHDTNAEAVGMKLTQAKLVIFGNPKLGSALMQQDIRAGLDLPLKILLYKESDAKVKMAYRDGEWLATQYTLNAAEKIEKMNMGMQNITTKAGQCIKD